MTKITCYEKICWISARLSIRFFMLQYIVYYSLQTFYFENYRPVFDLIVLWSIGLWQWMMEWGKIPSAGWMGGMAEITSSLIILARSIPISMSNQKNQNSPYAHTHARTNTQALQKAHLRNCRCRRDTAHRRKRRALRKSPSASRRPPRRRWVRMGSRSTTSPPLPQGS